MEGIFLPDGETGASAHDYEPLLLLGFPPSLSPHFSLGTDSA